MTNIQTFSEVRSLEVADDLTLSDLGPIFSHAWKRCMNRCAKLCNFGFDLEENVMRPSLVTSQHNFQKSNKMTLQLKGVVTSCVTHSSPEPSPTLVLTEHVFKTTGWQSSAPKTDPIWDPRDHVIRSSCASLVRIPRQKVTCRTHQLDCVQEEHVLETSLDYDHLMELDKMANNNSHELQASF